MISKLFKNTDSNELEKEINKFLDNVRIKIDYIKYSTCQIQHHHYGGIGVEYSVLIMYKQKN